MKKQRKTKLKKDSQESLPPIAPEEVKDYQAPYKLGLPILAPSGIPGDFDRLAVDHPKVFVHEDRFYMTYLGYDGISYQTALAVSDDLLYWKKIGMVFTRNQSKNDWDKLGRVVSSYVTEQDFRKNPELLKRDGKYTLFYHAYPGKGYEAGPPANGIAWADSPDSLNWTCHDRPVFTCNPEAGQWDSGGVYTIQAVPLVDGTWRLYYSAKDRDSWPWHEQVGIADPIDDTFLHWKRRTTGPVGRVGELPWNTLFAANDLPMRDSKTGKWMRYFMGFDGKHAKVGVGVSNDGIVWRHSPVPVLSEGKKGEIDEKHAHKVAHLWYKGDLYLIYCAVRPLHDDAERAKFKVGTWNEYRCLTIARSRPFSEDERKSVCESI